MSTIPRTFLHVFSSLGGLCCCRLTGVCLPTVITVSPGEAKPGEGTAGTVGDIMTTRGFCMLSYTFIVFVQCYLPCLRSLESPIQTSSDGGRGQKLVKNSSPYNLLVTFKKTKYQKKYLKRIKINISLKSLIKIAT